MFLVTKKIKGHEYYYLIERERRGTRVVTSRTIYVGNRKKLAEMVQLAHRRLCRTPSPHSRWGQSWR